MPFPNKRADLLERSLQGQPSTDPVVRNLVATVGRIPALTGTACAPSQEFVSALGVRLRAEALTLPARTALRGPSATGARRSGRPAVFVIGRRVPRVLVGAAASILVVGVAVGGASRSALPGGLLYPVKGLLDSAAVQLAGSEFDRGTTLLSQAQEHIGDARALVERDGAQTDPESVNQALLSALDAVNAGQRALLGEFDRNGNPQALIAVQDFGVRALPQLNALRPLVPQASTPHVDALIAVLQDTRTSLARRIAICGQPCASINSTGLVGSPGPAPTNGLPSTLTVGGLPVAGLPIAGLSGVPAPTAVITGPGAVVGQPAPTLLITTSGTTAVTLPAVTLGSVTVSPPPVVIPHLPLVISTPTTASLPTAPSGLP